MENKAIKCTSKEDENIDAISYCGECDIYMCNKCEKSHSKLFSKHQVFNLDIQNDNIFTGFWKEPKHHLELEFFCKTHNSLCCAACLCKLEKNGIGLHKDCDVCFIEDIKEEKKNKIKSNIKYLEELSNSFKDNIDNLKKIFEKIFKNKEELKLEIQKVFTKIWNEINNREDELLLEVEKQFNEIYFDENILKKCEKLPNNVKLSLDKGKNLEFNEDKLALYINECINIENNIKDINKVNESIKKCRNDDNIEIKFNYEEQSKSFFEDIKKFGKIQVFDNNNIFDSNIINKDKNKQETIINWIKQKTNKNIISLEKIFVMSINGSTSKDFHKYCDNKGPTLTIVKTTKNKIFGGFTPLNWDIDGGSKYDKENQTFLFSLNLMKKYDMINNKEKAIFCRSSNGPYFGGRDFSIESNMKKAEAYSNEKTNFLSNNNLELTGDKGNNISVDIEDFEIFKVNY